MVRMRCRARLILLFFLVFYVRIYACGSAGTKHWSQWSECSSTCGDGIRSRQKKCSSSEKTCHGVERQTKHCLMRFCPSYLSWPRIHFSGKMVADVNTVNNIRCSYNNDEYSPSELSKHFIGLEKKIGTHTYYKFATGNWNPDGSNQIYFIDTYVTSVCNGPSSCSLTESVVGLKIVESARGIMAVLDPDWQLATEIWGLKIKIPGVLEGDFGVASHQVEGTRVDHVVDKSVGYSIPVMSRYKSKIYNVTWSDDYYRNLFSDARELSISFVIDLFDQTSLAGRISGTIGLTSNDDPRQAMATRVLQLSGASLAKDRSTAPFYVHYPQRMLTLDLSASIGGRQNGSFFASDSGTLDLVLLMTKRDYCRHYSRLHFCELKGNEDAITFRRITGGGEISKRIGDDCSWYTIYGGIMDFDLSYLDSKTWNLIKHRRVAITDSNNEIYMNEFPDGISIGLTEKTIFRFNEGESNIIYGFVSSFGRPVKKARFNIFPMKNVLADTVCGHQSCNRTLGVPEQALGISTDSHVSLTNRSGLVELILKAEKDPGNPRGCGLDGQIYPLQIFVRYSKRGKTYTFSDSGLTSFGSGRLADYPANTQSLAAQIYKSIPEEECPTWKDVKEIFVQYYNLYPVMWRSGIIDLHSYEQIRKRAKMLKAAMFDTNIEDPRYMPISRDLSKGKSRLIHNWMKCGMRGGEPSSIRNANADLCKVMPLRKAIEDVRRLLQKAMMLELTAIPPYVNAWLSLKTEYGRNKEIASILKSVFNEEMLHMTLAGNILKAVGGVVNMTDTSKLPIYPTIFGSSNDYEISPDMQVGLAPFSIGLVDDVFSRIEKPSRFPAKQNIHHLAQIWKVLPSGKAESMVSKGMKNILEEMKRTNSSLHELSDINIQNTKNVTKDSFSAKANLDAWKKLASFSSEKLNLVTTFDSKTIGEFYSLVALKLTRLESCIQIRNLESAITSDGKVNKKLRTVFTGKVEHQLNISHWYQQSNDAVISVVQSMGGETSNLEEMQLRRGGDLQTRPPLFEVTDLKSALEAIVEIFYQGEGGSECSPLVTQPSLYASQRGRDIGWELSHYYRFREIVNGRKLVKVEKPREKFKWNCLNVSHPSSCPPLTQVGELYCYAGDLITFYADGVWPILFNPKEDHYVSGSKARHLHDQFNLIYTRLLFCLEESFAGKPSNIKKCMSLMYDMTMVGKRLVRTPLNEKYRSKNIEIGENGAPTWIFQREKPQRAGLPLRG